MNLTENSFIYGFQLKNEDWKLIHFEEYFHAIFSFRENIYRDDILTINRTILKAIPCDQVKMDKKIEDEVSYYLNMSGNKYLKKFNKKIFNKKNY